MERLWNVCSFSVLTLLYVRRKGEGGEGIRAGVGRRWYLLLLPHLHAGEVKLIVCLEMKRFT